MMQSTIRSAKFNVK
jgi:hypothetical protein